MAIFYNLPLVDILMILSVFFFLFESTRKKRFIIKTPQIVLLFGFLAAIALSHLSHTYFYGAFNSVVEFSKIVIPFILFVNIVNSERKIKISLWLIIIATVILAIQGIYQFNNGLGWAGQPLSLQGRINWVGIFNDGNDLALAIVMAIGFVFAFFFGKAHPSLKFLSAVFLGILLYALYLTNSRGGYVALAGTLLFYFTRRFKNKFIAISLGVIFVFTIFALGPSRLSTISASEESAYGRIDAWYQGMQMLKSSPIFGVGYGMFTEDFSITAHNSYLLVAAEEGIVGLFFWIALIYSCFKGLSVLVKRHPRLNSYALGLEANLVGFLCSAFFLSRSYKDILYIMLALISSCLYTFLKKDEYALSSKDIRISGFLSFAVLMFTWLTMRVSLRIAG